VYWLYAHDSSRDKSKKKIPDLAYVLNYASDHGTASSNSFFMQCWCQLDGVTIGNRYKCHSYLISCVPSPKPVAVMSLSSPVMDRKNRFN
jgi:hypothetical protein